MFTLRCTRKLLNRLPEATAEPRQPTTILGDWYANILFARPEQLVLCLSERSLLPVALPARNASALREGRREELARVLTASCVPTGAIDAELEEMQSLVFAPTRNRRVLSSRRGQIWHLELLVRERPAPDFIGMALHLAGVPYKPLEYRFPSEVAVELLAGGGRGMH